MLANILLYSTVAGSSTLAGVYLVRKYAAWTERHAAHLISFAVGVIMANAFFNLLPEAAELESHWQYFAFSGFMTLFLLEYGMHRHYCEEENCELRSIGVISAIGIGFHSLLDGFIIGVGFEVSLTIGLVTSFAVIFHELPEGVFTYTFLRHDQVPEFRALLFSWAVALATPIGAVMTYFLVANLSRQALGALIAIAGGTFIYIGAADLVPETHRHLKLFNALLVLCGSGFVYLLSRLL